MSREKGARGRPKGTGLDDTSRIRQIEALLDADPGLKPTTAIKAIGITDPSVIRRLRDKLALVRTPADESPHQAHRHTAPAEPVSRPRAVALQAVKPALKKTARIVEASAPAKAADSLKAAPAPAGTAEATTATARSSSTMTEPADWMMMWCGLGLQALTTTAMVQMAVVQKMLQMPVVATALKHQMMIGDLAASLTAPHREAPKVLH